MKKFVFVLLLIAFLGLVGFFLITQYSYVFSKTVVGQVLEVDRVTQPTMVLGTAATNSNVLYSFAVGIRTSTGDIFTGSSEDRQWAIVKRGLCVKARFFPYPPWDFEKGGTYFNVRMLELKDCPSGTPEMPEQATDKVEPAVPVTPSAGSQQAPQ